MIKYKLNKFNDIKNTLRFHRLLYIVRWNKYCSLFFLRRPLRCVTAQVSLMTHDHGVQYECTAFDDASFAYGKCAQWYASLLRRSVPLWRCSRQFPIFHVLAAGGLAEVKSSWAHILGPFPDSVYQPVWGGHAGQKLLAMPKLPTLWESYF